LLHHDISQEIFHQESTWNLKSQQRKMIMTKARLQWAAILMAIMSLVAQSWAADSLAVAPPHPTTADRITFTIIIPNWDCCTQYNWDSTVVAPMGDTGVLLTYTYNLPQVCPMTLIACINIPKQLVYKSAPLAAGTYSVYEIRVQCTNNICPPVPVAFLPVRIGSVTVTPSTGIVILPHRAPIASGSGINASGKIYDVRGVLVSSSAIHAGLRTPGVYLVKNGSQTLRTIVAP
jgi:hypothetical protein